MLRCAKRPSVPRLVVDRREHVRLRPEVAHLEEDAVRAAHAHEEVVHQRDALRGIPAWRADAIHRGAV